jgi:toxin ParE1/3/4
MKYRLRIYPSADADVEDAALFIARDNLNAALRFYDAVDKTFRQIRDHPMRWPRYELDQRKLAGLRKCSVIGFRKYLVFYLTDDDVVDVIRVLHGAREIPPILSDDTTDG